MNRHGLLDKLKTQLFDILVIGGGATGAGIALDAATRGLKVALVERDDFASGTSSRSTKLIHGGVRYLEQAVKKLDRGQFHLVREALHERARLIALAPHLAHPLPLVTPIYSTWKVPYFRIGLKMYDLLAGKQNLKPSRYLSSKAAKKNFPMLKAKGLRGGVLYYDGQFNDARMNVALALTAIEKGAVALNHVEVVELSKEGQALSGAQVRDTLSGETFAVRAKSVINATGPFADQIRKLDAPGCAPLLKTSSGVHIVLNSSFSPPETGLLIPETEDGRVLFLLPWLGHTLVGTTDNPAIVEDNPKATAEEIDYILRHIQKYFDIPVAKSDILATWCGLRPLVANLESAGTAQLSRDHVVLTSPSGLITITGGKWTTYRRMAEDAVDEAIQKHGLSPQGPSLTKDTPLYGAQGYSPQLAGQLSREYGLDPEVAQHLASDYGGKAVQIARLSQQTDAAQRLVPHHPYIVAEVIYALESELAESALDVLARRMRLTFLDAMAAKRALPKILAVIQNVRHWDAEQLEREKLKTLKYLEHNPF